LQLYKLFAFVPQDWINSAVVNDYLPGGCIVSHVDPPQGRRFIFIKENTCMVSLKKITQKKNKQISDERTISHKIRGNILKPSGNDVSLFFGMLVSLAGMFVSRLASCLSGQSSPSPLCPTLPSPSVASSPSSLSASPSLWSR
jgi:hypothetical protein